MDDTKSIDSGVIHLGISDHSLVYICRKVSNKKETTKLIETRQYKHFNALRFQSDLSEAFSSFSTFNDPNKALEIWKEIFLEIANKHAPLRQRRVKSEYCRWMTNEIKKQSYYRDYLKKKAVSLNSPYYFQAYKQCKNQLNKCIKETKRLHYNSKLANSTNSKESWQTIHELLNRKSKTTAINEINMKGKTIAGDEEIAKEFNKYFSEVGKKLADEIPDNDIDPLHYVNPVSNSFTFKTITEEDVNRIISSMKTCKSAGIDKISVKLIQAAGKLF
jgi:hypothetical protein